MSNQPLDKSQTTMIRMTNNKTTLNMEGKVNQDKQQREREKKKANHCHKANDDDSVWNDQKKKTERETNETTKP